MSASVKQFRSERGCLSYVLIDEKSDEAILIDPSQEVPNTEYLDYLKERGAKLLYIVETHTHADHISSNQELREATGAKILLHPDAPSDRKDMALSEGALQLGETECTILFTPGHTNDSICIVSPGAVFTGDTLLIGGTGRTDFQAGSSEELYQSLTKKLLTLPNETIVYPGHNYSGQVSSTIKDERATNKRLLLEREEFINAMDEHHPPKPDLFDKAIAENSK